jgi:hypothetical protein
MALWKVEMIINLEEGSHPRKWIPDSINEGLDKNKGEDVLNWEWEPLSEEDVLNLG